MRAWDAHDQHVPQVWRDAPMSIGRGGALGRGEVLPPTSTGWQRFLALAPATKLKWGELNEAADYWWGRAFPKGLLGGVA